MFADIDADNPGYEFYAAEQKRELGQFLYSARDGKLLSTADLGSNHLESGLLAGRARRRSTTLFRYSGTTTALQKSGTRRRSTRSTDASWRSPTSLATGAKS